MLKKDAAAIPNAIQNAYLQFLNPHQKFIFF